MAVGGGHSTGTSHLDGRRRAFWSALRVRGGEVDQNCDVTDQLVESVKSPDDTAQQAEEVRDRSYFREGTVWQKHGVKPLA